MENTSDITSTQQDNIISMGRWFWSMVLVSIPVVNVIMICIWAFRTKTTAADITFGNWAKAHLIFIGIWILLLLIFGSILFSMLLTVGSTLYNNI